MENIVDFLQQRGLVDATTSPEIRALAAKPLRVYVGFDPTSDSLHLGNLVGIVMLAHFQRFGHTPVVVLGGATGRIGDPSGKNTERPLLDEEAIAHNVARIAKHFERILMRPLLLNNYDWYASFGMIDFLRDVGKHFRVGAMLGKESVRARLESEEGISFTEFSYQLLQAYDFYHLFTKENVVLQMGGSDQWGNITAGVELIRKLTAQPAYGLTFPLLTRSDGKKFGKSESGAIWLAEDRLSVYEFYQYLVRIPDADVIKLMRMLTFMPMQEIAHFEEEMRSSRYVPNTAQKKLAEEITRMVHGDEGLQVALKVTEGASPGSHTELNVEALRAISKDMPSVHLSFEEIIGKKWIDAAVRVGLVSSKGEALRLVQNAGAYLNNERVSNPGFVLASDHLIGQEFLLFGSGKKKKILCILKKLA